MLLATLKDKKSSHDDNEGNSAFKTIAKELYQHLRPKRKKEHLRLVMSSIRVGVVSSVVEQLTIISLVPF